MSINECITVYARITLPNLLCINKSACQCHRNGPSMNASTIELA